MMFLGEFRQAVSEEGWFALPQAFSLQNNDELILTRGFDHNLLLYSGEEWRRLAGRLLQKPISSSAVRALRRRLFSNAVVVKPDGLGRISIPASLRDFAGIGSALVVAGLYDHLELWSEEEWQAVLEDVTSRKDDGRWDVTGV